MADQASQRAYGTADGHRAEIAALLREFRAGQKFIVTSHARPDGDAVGSALAVAEMLDQLGCTVEVVMADAVPYVYKTLPGVERIAVRESAGDGKEPALLLECDGIERTGLKGLEGRRLLNIDHHASGRRFGAVNWIDEHACAVAAMVYALVMESGVKMTPSIATNLYTAVLTDTGSFTYPGTGAQAFQLACDLVEAGADAVQVARDVYFSNREAKLRLLGLSLNHLCCEDGLAWSWIMLEDFARCGAINEDCEGVVNYLIGIDGVQAAVFLRELETGEFRLSIRSKGGMDVSKIASDFCGGGHRSASGCTIAGPLDAAVETIVRRLRAEM